MAVRFHLNSYLSKFMDLSRLGYDAQLIVTCVNGHLSINIQQSLLPCHPPSHQSCQEGPNFRRQYQHYRQPHQSHQHLPREQPARRRRREERALIKAAEEAAKKASAKQTDDASPHPHLVAGQEAAAVHGGHSVLTWPGHYQPSDVLSLPPRREERVQVRAAKAAEEAAIDATSAPLPKPPPAPLPKPPPPTPQILVSNPDATSLPHHPHQCGPLPPLQPERGDQYQHPPPKKAAVRDKVPPGQPRHPPPLQPAEDDQHQHPPSAPHPCAEAATVAKSALSIATTPPVVEEAVETWEVEAEEVSHVAVQAAVASPVPPSFPSFSFKPFKDPPPPPPPRIGRRATPRPKHSRHDTLFNIRKPVRIIKIHLKQNVDRGVWNYYHLPSVL